MGFSGNLQEQRQKLLDRKQRLIDATEEMAKEIAETFIKNTRPLARVDTGRWQSTIDAKPTKVSEGVWDIWMGSEGCFAPDGFDYGAFWNFFDGTIDTGIFISQPDFDQIIQKFHDEAVNVD
jgi:hypothetical protein